MHDWLKPLPRLTADLPGLGGVVRQELDDFIVEEIPAYEPCGEGEHLYLWIEKRDLGADFFLKQLAHRLGVPKDAIGTAGLKDRRAVTRQWVSVPQGAEPRLAEASGDDLRILKHTRHGNKLRPGHLRGNQFIIRIRGVDPEKLSLLPALLERLRGKGMPNYYGEQRFGRDGETLELGLRLLRGEQKPLRNRFLQKLALSAVQSALFNLALAERLTAGLLFTALEGDVMAKQPTGGLFVVKEVATEQARFGRGEILPAGPMFGKKMYPAEGAAAAREAAVLEGAGLKLADFDGFGKLLQGTRREYLCPLPDLAGEAAEGIITLRFTLPPGSYATVLLDEVMKLSEPIGEPPASAGGSNEQDSEESPDG